MRITTKKGRDFAFKLRRIRNDRTGKKRWFVGITTKEYFWLDLSAALGTTALWMAKELAKRLNTTVYVFVTTKSYWLVTKKKLFNEEWDREFKYWLGFPESFVCHAFCECCIRYHKATLRVSAKKGKRPKLVKVINRLEGGQGDIFPPAPRLRDFPKSQRVEALPIVPYPEVLYKLLGRLVAKCRLFEREMCKGGLTVWLFLRPHFGTS